MKCSVTSTLKMEVKKLRLISSPQWHLVWKNFLDRGSAHPKTSAYTRRHRHTSMFPAGFRPALPLRQDSINSSVHNHPATFDYTLCKLFIWCRVVK